MIGNPINTATLMCVSFVLMMLARKMHVGVFITVLFYSVGYISALCTIPPGFRGRHQLVNSHFDRIPGEALIIRTHYVEIVKDGKTQQLDCIDSQHSDILLRTTDQSGVLCLQLPQIMDVPAEFHIRRRNVAAPSGGLFTPSPISNDVIPTIENQCTVYINSDVFTSRARPGCSFPVALQKTWTYASGHLSQVSFTNTSAIMTLKDGNNFTADCERHDTDRNGVHRIAVRTSLDLNHDGVMCLVLRSLSGGKLLSQLANVGDRYMNQVKTIFFMEPIYLYETCDLMDTLPEGVVMQPSGEA